MKWRLGIDLGTNSLGWAILRLNEGRNPVAMMDSGVRCFSDGRDAQSGASNAATRREPRGHRINHDRYLMRRKRFMTQLVRFGLMPQDKAERKKLENLDPWQLRLRGLDEELSAHELGRALFHLQQRRGFKSNRKTDKGEDSGKIKQANQKMKDGMTQKNSRTIAEYLAGEPTKRARLSGTGTKSSYDFYITRDLVEDEFDQLWQAQKPRHPKNLSEEAYKQLKKALLDQRPLKPQQVGKCTLEPTQERAPKALPSFQYFRILQEVNNLEIRLPGQASHKLTQEQRDKLVSKLLGAGKVSFDAMRKTHLKLPENVLFNIESEKRKHLDGDKTATVLASGKTAKRAARWGKAWRDLSLTKQDAIVEILVGYEADGRHFDDIAKSVADALEITQSKVKKLLATTDEAVLHDWLVTDFGLDEQAAIAVASAPIPTGHGNLGRTALAKIIPELALWQEFISQETGEVIAPPRTYDLAVLAAGYDSHSDLDGKDTVHYLPYYGKVLDRHVAFGTGEPTDRPEKQFGKLANPTVHVAMNQVRKVTNALIRKMGCSPEQIVVEVARDLPLSAQGKKDLETKQKENQDKNDARRKILLDRGEQDNYDNRMRLRLWEELNPKDPLNRRCPYTGENIGIDKLFTKDVEIDHILPFSRTFDDSPANKTVSMRYANQYKGRKTPNEAFSQSPEGYDWDRIEQTIHAMPAYKKWRFAPDAMDRFDEDEKGFLARQLGDTRYISRLSKTYLKATGADVWVVTGRLTAHLRHVWGLDSVLAGHNQQEAANPQKNRNDHRHHAVDAITIGLTSRAMLKKMSDAAKQAEKMDSHKLMLDFKEPWPAFRNDVVASIDKIIVSHKPDHGVQGALHDPLPYGEVIDPISGEKRLVKRMKIDALSFKQIENIGDLKIRADLVARREGLKGTELAKMLEAYSKETGHKRVRVHKVQADYEVIRHGKNNQHSKAVIPGENFCVDIIELADGKWKGVGVTRFQANQQKRNGQQQAKWQQLFPDARLIMRVHKGDLLKLIKEGKEDIMRVQVLNAKANRFYLALHKEANTGKDRHDNPEDHFRWDLASFSKLKERRARLIHVDAAGTVYDPGFSS